MGAGRYLLDGEDVLLVTRPHWLVVLGPAATAAAALVLAGIAGYVSGPRTSGDVIDIVFGSIAALAFARFVWAVVRWWVARILVTNRRVLSVSGAFSRRVDAVALATAAALTYRRSMAGRIFGYGDFVSEGAPAGLRYSRVSEPDLFFRTVQEAAHGVAVPMRPADEDDTGPLPRVRA